MTNYPKIDREKKITKGFINIILLTQFAQFFLYEKNVTFLEIYIALNQLGSRREF